jgi:hypothetical protein
MFVLKNLPKYIFKIKDIAKQKQYEKGAHLNDVKIGINYLCDVFIDHNTFEISLSLNKAEYIYGTDFTTGILYFAVYYNQMPIFCITDEDYFQIVTSCFHDEIIVSQKAKVRLLSICSTYFPYNTALPLYNKKYAKHTKRR